MRYIVEVLNESKIKTSELTGMTKARLYEKINSPGVITVETIEKSEFGFVLPGRGFLRLKDLTGQNCGTFRIIEAQKTRVKERISLSIKGCHILSDTAREVFADAVNCLNYTPAELLELVLTYSGFGAGEVDPTTAIPFVRFEYETIYSSLLRICRMTGGELSFDEENLRINILDSAGSDNGVVFRYGINLKSASKIVNVSSLANRVYGAGGGDPALNLTSATQSRGYRYTADANSEAAYGIYSAVYQDPTLEEVVNLILTPALDGKYSSGLCQDWTKTGNPVLSKNIAGNYFLYGKASQRIQGESQGDGIRQIINLTQGKVYSLTANIFLVSGTVRVQVNDGGSVYRHISPLNGTGFATIDITNWKPNNNTVTVKIFQENSGSSDFYVDSVQVNYGGRAMTFTIGKSADELWNRSFEYLNSHKEPEITYEVDLVDLYGETQNESDAGIFGIGDTVRVVDTALEADVTTRVAEKDTDILRPWRAKVKLANASKTLADVFTALREAQQESIKYQRAVLVRSSKALETNAAGQGFCSLSFRFFGALTASSWNGINWSAGTLRAGDYWYSVLQGEVSGLSAESTYYFYFDRTSLDSFGYTLNISEAESEDRLLVFSVTTTSSQSLCVIHPMGIIKT